jgi:nitrogen fixation NifU-like protein
MSELKDLYQDVILDHNRHPRNFGPLPGADHEAEGYNPLCGDRITVRLKLEGDVIRDIRFEGSGCAISTASASVMTESLKGKTVAEARALFGTFHALVTGKAKGEASIATLGKLAVFSGVSEFPVRVKCATLCWHTTQSALDAEGETVSTE